MDIIKLTPRRRAARASPRLRRDGQIPAIAYGKELAGRRRCRSRPRGCSESSRAEHGQNTVVELGIDGGKKLTVAGPRLHGTTPSRASSSTPTSSQIKLDQPVDVEVPFLCNGKATGVVARRHPPPGLPQPPDPLPARADPGRHRARRHRARPRRSRQDQRSQLPEGVSVRLPADQTVVGVVAPEKEKPEDARPELPVPRRRCCAWRTRRCRSGSWCAGAAAAAAGAAGAAAAPAKDDKKAAAARTRRSNQAGSARLAGAP